MNNEWRESLPRNQIVGFDQVKDDDARHAHGLAPSLVAVSWILQLGASCFGAEGKAGLARAKRVALGAEASWASVAALASMAALLSSTNAPAAVLLRNDRPTPTSSPPPPPSTRRQLTTRTRQSGRGRRRRGFAFGAPAPPRPTDFARTAPKKPVGLAAKALRA